MEKNLLIQKYINNKLIKEEQVLFDDLFKNDINFRGEVQLHKDLKVVIKKEQRISLKKEFQKIDASKTLFNWTKLLVAASFALLLSVSSFFIFKDNGLSSQELFATNFEPYRNVMHPVVRGEENLSKIEQAFVFYENDNYTKFIELIEKSNYKNKDYNFYIAVANLANDNPKEAKLIFGNYLSFKGAKFITKTHWYLGLSYLKLDNLQKAKTEFEFVKNKGNFKQKEAIKLLKLLD